MKRLAFLLPLLVGCDVTTTSYGSNADYEALVLARANIEFNCPSANITVTVIDHYTYLAEGCGYRATYECDLQPTAASNNECQRAPDLELVDAGCK